MPTIHTALARNQEGCSRGAPVFIEAARAEWALAFAVIEVPASNFPQAAVVCFHDVSL